jgi:hypothetical protein
MELLYLLFEIGLGILFLYVLIKYVRCKLGKQCEIEFDNKDS